jgi:iron complex outermembrane recepter protein
VNSKSGSELVRKSVVLALALHGTAYAAEAASTAGTATKTTASVPATVASAALAVAGTPVLVAANTTVAAADAATDTTAAAPAADQAADTSVAEVTVTGTRITARPGYESPTPLTVVSTEMLQQSADPDLRDTMMEMPQFAGGYSLQLGAGVPSFNEAGIESLELRSLGPTRTLVLLDGQRAVGSIATGVVDVGAFPEQLVKRVETVTGGASAVYGSDAVAGVVNFILDHDFTGTKVNLEGGETTYGDDRNYKLEISEGFRFAGGRGHVLLSGEYYNNDGVVDGNGDRAWAQGATNYILNPANPSGAAGLPQYIIGNNVFLAQGTHGGIINSAFIGGKTYTAGVGTQLPGVTGVAFGTGGVPYNFQYGTYSAAPGISDLFMAGGDYRSTLTDTAFSLAPSEKRENIFTRVQYDLTDNANVFVQVSRSVDTSFGIAFPQYQVGNTIKVNYGNPYIPASIAALMHPGDYLYLGSTNYDMGFVDTGTARGTNRYVLGSDGTVNLFGSPWKWDVYGQIGTTHTDYTVYNARNNANYTAALNSVAGPLGPTCATPLPANAAAGCIPWDPFGTGVNSAEAKSYILGNSYTYQGTRQDVYSASFTGDPFSDWAGPVSLAFNTEYRQEAADVRPNAISLFSGWSSGNLQPLSAQTHVKEAAIETLIPLLADKPFAQNWDLNAAFRATDYQVSGYVSTWKLGTTWAPVQDIKIRGTASRDIRAPNISELFQAQNYGLISDFDPVTGQNVTHGRTQLGNPNLKPEIANNYTGGVVLTPSFLPGFGASVDYWKADIKDAIGLVSASQVIVLCYDGSAAGQALCPWITRDPVTNKIITVQQGYFNLASEDADGVDYEVTYALPLEKILPVPGKLSAHLTGTLNIKNVTNDGLGDLLSDAAGSYALPKNIVNTSLTYDLDRFSYTLAYRYFSSTVQNTNYIECTTDCPASTTQQRTFNQLTVAGGSYFDASIFYHLEGLFSPDGEGRLYLNVKNLTNKDPPLTPQLGTTGLGYIYSRSQGGRWDKLGRIFTLGIEYKFK